MTEQGKPDFQIISAVGVKIRSFDQEDRAFSWIRKAENRAQYPGCRLEMATFTTTRQVLWTERAEFSKLERIPRRCA
jgi:hypothetical protein